MAVDRKRIRLGLDLVTQGSTFRFGSLLISGSEHGRIKVTGFSNYRDLANLTRAIAENELASIKEEFRELISESPDFVEHILGKPITFQLTFDYGKGGIPICSETNGQLTWDSELP